MRQNLNQYNSTKTINRYKKLEHILKPEKIIFDYLKNLEIEKRNLMLDIGVGAGRTSEKFSSVFKKYIGIDYAEEMIKHCNTIFNNTKNMKFVCSDARNIDFVSDDYVDFIFFSFNGIDCVSYDDRIKILTEVKRIAKKCAYFAFSTHNLNNIKSLFSYQFPKNPLKWAREYKRYIGVHNNNEYNQLATKKDYAYIFDGDNNNFNYRYVYVNPEFQIKELSNLGFEIIKIIDIDGLTINPNSVNWSKFTQPWIHFLCKVKK